jgi:hypothetical protein
VRARVRVSEIALTSHGTSARIAVAGDCACANGARALYVLQRFHGSRNRLTRVVVVVVVVLRRRWRRRGCTQRSHTHARARAQCLPGVEGAVVAAAAAAATLERVIELPLLRRARGFLLLALALTAGVLLLCAAGVAGSLMSMGTADTCDRVRVIGMRSAAAHSRCRVELFSHCHRVTHAARTSAPVHSRHGIALRVASCVRTLSRYGTCRDCGLLVRLARLCLFGVADCCCYD